MAITGMLLGASLLAGCPGRQASPEDTVRAFAEALDAGEWEAAYGLLAESYRRRVPFEEFRRHLQAHPAEVRELVGMMGHVGEAEAITARVPFPDGDALELRREDAEWVVVGNAVDFYDQSSPRAALRSFVRAMERRRYDVVLRFVPQADREGMTVEHMERAWEGEAREEIDRLVASLRASLDEPIEVVGERATMTYGEGATVQFVREDGLWRIEDPD
ncbi:MAG: hypothetical protein CMN31_24555 [Sandaracinus sp.]|nr:hypothetical protein [Myxococcales bacterium]MBJ74462.1 hypothetical protein [Sandaracinus sp.]